MKVTTRLHVSADYLFARLIETALYDLNKETGKNLTSDELENQTYLSKINDGQTVELTIVKVVKNKALHMMAKSQDETMEMGYDLVAVGPNEVDVTYFEQLKQAKLLTVVQDRIKNMSLGWLKKHNFVKVLKEFEAGY
ncbi:protein of unknown function [Ligilactobacillus sp. WC1T17]|uniref:DUF3284 domain-containing protein n=1 Tax=Ligilactobacillus ruminis TaxID=1623 RepID=A0ABY1AC20_9LACO|nr:protein of unknown function [Ligilactobacillus ruminis]